MKLLCGHNLFKIRTYFDCLGKRWYYCRLCGRYTVNSK